MKKILAYLVSAVVALAAIGCNKENIEESFGLLFSETQVTISPSGSLYKLVYKIAGLNPNQTLVIVNDSDWLTVNKDKARIIELTATRNETGESRTAELTFSYPGAEDVLVTVHQPAWVDPIDLTILETESTSIKFSIATKDENLTWVGQVVGKEWFDSMESDEQIFQEDMSYYLSKAQELEIPISDYISSILNKGSYSALQYKGLDPSSDYVVYVYGLSMEGERTTDIYHAETTTLPPYDGPITLDIQIVEENNVMDITVSPSHDGVMYYSNLMDKASFDEIAAKIKSDAPVDVFTQYIKDDIAELIELEWLSSKAEYYEWYSVMNKENYQFEPMACTDYIIFACKWNESCEFVDEPAYKWYTSADVDPSDNQITMQVSDIDQSSFYVNIATTNDDPYVMIAEPSEFVTGMDKDAIFAHLIEDYGNFGLLNFVFNGDVEGRMTGLEPDSEYTCVTFGYKAGRMTTEMQIQTIRTLPAGPVEDCTFEFTLKDVGTNSLSVYIEPSDASHFYYAYVYPADATAEEVKQDVLGLLNGTYYGDMYEFGYYELSQGKTTYDFSLLGPETDYKVGLVIMDYDSGKFLSDVIFSDVYTTGEADYADITVSLSYDKFYNGDDWYKLDKDAGAQYKGHAVVPVTLTIEGEYKSYYYTIFEYENGMENPELYPDAAFYEALVYNGVYYSESVNFRAPWAKWVMLAAVAIDNDDRFSVMYRKKCRFYAKDASDISELMTKSAPSHLVNCIVPYRPDDRVFEVKKTKEEGDDRFSKESIARLKKEIRLNRF